MRSTGGCCATSGRKSDSYEGREDRGFYILELPVTALRWRSSLALGLLIVLALGKAHAQTDEIRCDYTRRVDCDAKSCTNQALSGNYLLLPPLADLLLQSDLVDLADVTGDNPKLPAIRRCDAKGCSPVPVRATMPGAFVDLNQDSGSYFVRFAALDLSNLGGPKAGDFIEVAPTFLSTITYFGSCPNAARSLNR
jgi:hypothetical protein